MLECLAVLVTAIDNCSAVYPLAGVQYRRGFDNSQKSPTMHSPARRMRLSWKSSCLALVLAMPGTRAAGTSGGGLVRPVLSLAEQLGNLVAAIMKQPRDERDHLLASQELGEMLGNVAELITDRLGEFADTYDACGPVLKPLTSSRLIFSCSEKVMMKDYEQRHQCSDFLRDLCEAYHTLIYHVANAVESWREIGINSFNNLTKILKISLETNWMGCELALYHNHIFCSDPKVLLYSPEDPAGPVGEAISSAAEKIGNFEQAVCADYRALANRMVDAFEQMVGEFRGLLWGLEGDNRVSAYDHFKGQWLWSGFEEWMKDPLAFVKVGRGGSNPGSWSGWLEVLFSVRVCIFRELLELKLEVLELDHGNLYDAEFFSLRSYATCGVEDGPPLIGNGALKELRQSLKSLKEPWMFKRDLEELGNWI